MRMCLGNQMRPVSWLVAIYLSWGDVALQPNTRLSSWPSLFIEAFIDLFCLLFGEDDEEDPFASFEQIVVSLLIFLHPQIDEGFSEDDLEANLQRDKYARLCNDTVNQLIDELTPSAPDFQLRDACDQLVQYWVDGST